MKIMSDDHCLFKRILTGRSYR